MICRISLSMSGLRLFGGLGAEASRPAADSLSKATKEAVGWPCRAVQYVPITLRTGCHWACTLRWSGGTSARNLLLAAERAINNDSGVGAGLITAAASASCRYISARP